MALDLHKYHWGGDRDTPAAAEEKTWFGWRIVGPVSLQKLCIWRERRPVDSVVLFDRVPQRWPVRKDVPGGMEKQPTCLTASRGVEGGRGHGAAHCSRIRPWGERRYPEDRLWACGLRARPWSQEGWDRRVTQATVQRGGPDTPLGTSLGSWHGTHCQPG